MNRTALALLLALPLAAFAQPKVASDTVIGGFTHPESVGCDPMVRGGALYVTDNRGDQIFKVESADFCVITGKTSLTAYVPDLVQSQVRIIELR